MATTELKLDYDLFKSGDECLVVNIGENFRVKFDLTKPEVVDVEAQIFSEGSWMIEGGTTLDRGDLAPTKSSDPPNANGEPQE